MNNLHKFISYYFLQSQKVVENNNPKQKVIIQFFQRKDFAVLAGIKESIQFLKKHLKNKNTIIRFLKEGSKINSKEVVLELEGFYEDFGIYEGIIDGILSRATSLATNAYHCVSAANNKEVICMSDRSDHYINQIRDGKSFYVGGIKSFSSFAQSPNKKCIVYGSMPHALIQNFSGDLIKALTFYQKEYPKDPLIALVDYHNNVISDSLHAWKYFKHDLKGVRVDTSINMIDKMFEDKKPEFGVNVTQIKQLRQALNAVGAHEVKIFVSSGFTPEKIKEFEDQNTPVDGYGVGEYLLKINHTFCADATKLNSQDCSKEGRKHNHNPKLKTLKWK